MTLKNQQFIFNNVALTDSKYFSTAFLNGYIEHNNFSDWQLGLDLTTDRLLVLDTKESEDELYYGTGFVSGEAEITIDNEFKLVSENESVYIPIGAIHRMKNPGEKPMELIEVQTGSYFGEDDIVRIQDDFDRD